MVVAALSWLAGACVLLRWPTLPEPSTVLAVGAASLLAAALARRPGLAAFALGFGLAWLQCGLRLGDRLDPALEGETLQVTGRVGSVPQAVGAALRFRFVADAGSGLPALVELTWYEPDFRPLAAERLEIEVRLRRPRGFANPGGGDYEARLLREGIGATGYVRAARRLGRGAGEIARAPVLVARDTIAAAIRDTLGERPAAGIVAGLSVGLQDALSPQQWRQLARSGTTHLMAISGMHVGVFALVAGWTAGRLQRWRQRRGATRAARDVAVIAGSAAALGYAALAGWSVPAQRTALMIAIAAGALWWRRRVGPADALAAGAITVLLLQPLAPLAVGFWLSFGAVAAILLATAGESRSTGMLRGYAQTQWAVTAGLVPALVGSFGQVSLVSVLVNFVAIPLYTLLVVPAVLVATTLVLLLPAAGGAALGMVAALIEFSWPLISVPASWTWATWGVAAPGLVAWSLLLTGAAAALAPLPAPGRGAGLLLAAAACLWRPAAPPEGALRFTLLDVGQGLAAVVQTRRHVLVYDAGPAFRSGRDAGAIAVEPYLRARGLRHVDLLVASHDDLDHAGGAASVAGLVPVARLAASGGALDALGAVERCRRGRRWQWDGVEFEWLHPGPAPPAGDNDASCVLRVRAGPHELLLTGDIEATAEAELVATGVLGPVAVLTVPHHGSRTSSTADFVAATRPRWALVAAGHRNRWGFPRPEVVQRWRAAGAEVLGSPGSGAIEFEIEPGRAIAAPREWRRERRRAWHDP